MLDVLTIGTATRDVFLGGGLFHVLHDPEHLPRAGFPTGAAECFSLGSKIEVSDTTFAVGGGAANAAVTFARSGLSVAAAVRIGSDTAGRDVEKHLTREGVRVRSVIDPKRATAYSTILRAPGGERIVLVYRGASEVFSRAELAGAVRPSRWVYVAPGAIHPNVLIPFLASLRNAGSKIAVNPSSFYLSLPKTKLLSLLRICDVVISNREEAALMTEVPYHDTKGIFKKFDELIPGIAVMTDGSRGAHVSDGTSVWSTGTFKERLVLDRTGAGDAFGSGFVSAIASGEEIGEAIRRGSANATSVIEAIGAEAGILSRSGYRAPRWKKLPVSKTTI